MIIGIMLAALLLFFCVGAAAIGGVFFAFSAFVLRALSDLPAESGIAAMQRINIVVLNRLFLGVFMGTAVLALALAVIAVATWSLPRSALLLAAAGLYFVGSFMVTLGFNVPRNNHLARLSPTSSEALSYWPAYVREWGMWNHVRTVASLASCACSASAMSFL
jgi:uncharacterized membrane protein